MTIGFSHTAISTKILPYGKARGCTTANVALSRLHIHRDKVIFLFQHFEEANEKTFTLVGAQMTTLRVAFSE